MLTNSDSMHRSVKRSLTVVGGGLAGCEAAWQAANMGMEVTLFEMRPHQNTPAHKTAGLAEVLCSNSFRSNDPDNPHGLLKEELRQLGSLLIQCADRHSVPAGKALAVDREKFSALVTARIENHPNISLIRKEVVEIPDETTILASGPLTSDTLADQIEGFLGDKNLYFYDAISPVIDADSIDYDKAFFASRYEEGGTDYLNLPFTETEYSRFYDALMAGERTPLREFEKPKFFQGCMPVEVIAESGRESLLFGPMRPKGIFNPRTGKRPFAVMQLRREELAGKMYNLVGFQTRLKHGAQKEVLQLVPGLENVEILRYGGMHRNTFINSPSVLDINQSCRNRSELFFAGQITGVEGYVESIASGLFAGIAASLHLLEETFDPPPDTTATGALLKYISTAPLKSEFQPMNINLGLFPSLGQGKVKKRDKKRLVGERALKDMIFWIKMNNLHPPR